MDGLLDGLKGLFGTAGQDPIVLDLDGDGVETLGQDAGVFFDHDANGFAQLFGWVASDDGLLVWNRNGNGQIDDGSELFGNNNLLENGQKAASGSLPWTGMGGVPLRALEERFAAETDATGRQALLEQIIFTWDGVADLPVVLRMTTRSNACRLQHSRAAFSGPGFCRLTLQRRPECYRIPIS